MANQWGRDANVATGGSRSSFGLIILFFIALFVGLAGGYAGFRFLSGVSMEELSSRDARIAELEKTISDLRFNNDGVQNEQSALEKEIDLLRVKLGQANQTIETMRQEAEAAGDERINDLQARLDKAEGDNAVLRRELEDGDALVAALEKARQSQRVAERQILDLEREIAAGRSQIDTLKAQLASQSAGLDQSAREQIKALTDQNAKLSADLDRLAKQSRQDQATLEDKVAELTAVADKAGKDLAAANKLAQQQADMAAGLKAETDRIAKDLARQKTLNKDLEGRLTAALAELANDNDGAALLARLTEERDALQAKLSTATGALADARARIKTLTAANADLEANAKALISQIETLRKQIAEIDDKPVKPGDDNLGPSDTLKPRTSSAVDRALARMPSLDRLNDDQQAELRARLEDGACVTDALESVFDRVPVLALRNLMRDLKSPC